MAALFHGNLASPLRKKFLRGELPQHFLHAHVNHSVIHAPRADQNPAGPQHLDSLLDEYALVASATRLRPSRRRAAGGGTRAGSSPLLNNMRACSRAAGSTFAGYKIKKLAPSERSRYWLEPLRSTCNRRITSVLAVEHGERNPVETVWIGKEGSISPSRKLVARTTVSRSCAGPNLAHLRHLAEDRLSDVSSKRTGTCPR